MDRERSGQLAPARMLRRATRPGAAGRARGDGGAHAVRDERRELTYEALLAAGRETWTVGDKIHVYRKRNGGAGLLDDSEDGAVDARDYDPDHYARQLRQTFASRLLCDFTAEDYEAVFSDPNQMSLFASSVAEIRTVLEGKVDGARISSNAPIGTS